MVRMLNATSMQNSCNESVLCATFLKVTDLLFLSLSSLAEFSEVESDFHAKVPAVFCRDVSK